MEHALTSTVLQACVFLAATSLLVPAFRRFGLSAVMAFLVIGLLMGPHILGRLAGLWPWIGAIVLDPSGPTRWLADFGVVFLLFMIGLEVSPERLWALRRLVLGLGVSQMAITAMVVCAVAYAFGNSFASAAVTGLALALSSTAVVLQLLAERRQLGGAVGRVSFSILLLQDIAVIPILFMVAAMSARGPMQVHDLLAALAAAALTIAAILVVGRFVMRPLFRWASVVDSREVFVAATLLVVVVAAAASAAAGLSMALGAFLAGLLLAETEFRHEIEADIEPFKGLLLGLFFVTVGMKIELPLVLSQPVQVFAGVVGLYLVKASLLAPLARFFGLSWPQAVETAFLLAQAGEFAFVVITLAERGGLYPPAAAEYMLVVMALSIFLAPPVSALGVRIARRMAKPRAAAPEEMAGLGGHVIIAGYGRVGQVVGEILQAQDVAHVALDSNVGAVTRLRQLGWPVHFGDATRREVLKRVGAERASAIVVTMDSAPAVEHVVRVAREVWPNVPVFARARDFEQARRFHEAGAAYATPETIEATLQLGEALLNALGVPDEVARRAIGERREVEHARALLNRPAAADEAIG